MTKTFCDLCGKEIPPNPYRDEIHYRVAPMGSMTTATFDLCPKCKDELSCLRQTLEADFVYKKQQQKNQGE